MKKYSLFFLFFSLLSCDLFTHNRTPPEKIAAEELKTINWKEIDQYPLFRNCDETADKAQQKQCFETTFAIAFSEALQQQPIKINHSAPDTLWIELLVSPAGKVELIKIEKIDNFKTEDISKIDSIVKNSLSHLPSLYPPLKRNVPVAAKFRLPLVVKVE